MKNNKWINKYKKYFLCFYSPSYGRGEPGRNLKRTVRKEMKRSKKISFPGRLTIAEGVGWRPVGKKISVFGKYNYRNFDQIEELSESK